MLCIGQATRYEVQCTKVGELEMRRIIFAFMFLLAVSAAQAGDSKYDPYLLANEHKSEYTSYLKSLFEQAKPVPVEKVLVIPKLKKGLPGYSFRSEIRRQARSSGVNFAGEWTLVVVGCGTGCAQYFLVNAKTGKVIDPHITSTNGIPLFVKDKSIVVTVGSVDARTLDEAKKGAWGGPKAWRLDGKSFKEIAL